MMDSSSLPDPKGLQRRTYRYEAQDGLTEFLAGIMFIFISRVVAEPHLAWVPALLLFPMRYAARFFKTRFTYPRVGYVKLKSEDGKSFGLGVFTYLGGVLVAMGLGLWIFGDITSWSHWARWMPALVGGFCSGAFIYLVQRTGFLRHYFLVVVCLGWGVACSIMAFPTVYLALRRWALGLGVACLVVGVVVFLAFLRKHPVRSEEASNGQA